MSNKRGQNRYQTGSRRVGGRRVATVGPRKNILIVCEGEKTEPTYFNHLVTALRLATVRVAVDVRGDGGSAPISVVDRALELRAQQNRDAKSSTIEIPYDEVWCVMDVDRHPSMGRAYQKARAHGLSLAISNPCFEYWFILHFEKTGHPFMQGLRI